MESQRLLGTWSGELSYVGPDWAGTELDDTREPMTLEVRDHGGKLVASYREREEAVVVTALELDALEDDVTFYVPAQHPSGRPAATRSRGKLSEAEDRLGGEWEMGVLTPEVGESFLDDIVVGTWTLKKVQPHAWREPTTHAQVTAAKEKA